jgi:parvulin-like peptidyl-prolyl isomerase
MSLTGMRKRFEAHMKVIMWAFAFIFLISVFFFYGAYMSGPRTQGGTRAPYVLATAGGEKITRDELQARLDQLQRGESAPTLATTEWTRYGTLQNIIMEKLLRQDARNRGLRVSGDEIDRQIGAMVQQTLERETRGRTPSRQREAELEGLYRAQWDTIEQQILIAKLVQAIVGKVSVAPKEAQDAFEQVKARHILVSFSPTLKRKRTEEEALRRAQELHARVLKGEDFAAVARKESDDVGSAQKGGDLGWFGRGMMAPEFEKAAFALKPGQVSAPTRSVYGYHIIRVEGKRLPGDFAKKRKTYEEQLLTQKKKGLWTSYMEGLQKGAGVKILDPEFLGFEAMMDMKGREKEAIGYFNRALRYAPALGDSAHAALLWCLASQYAALHKWGKAAQAYEQATDVATDSLDEIYLSLAQMYISMHKPSRAIEQLRAAVDEAPENAMVSSRVQQFYRQLGREELAKAEQKRMAEALKKSSSATEPQPGGGGQGE